MVRNGYGFLVLLAGGAGVFLVTWYGDGHVQSVAAYLTAWLLLLAAPRPLLELLTAGRRRRRTSDPDQLAGLTRVPALLWILFCSSPTSPASWSASARSLPTCLRGNPSSRRRVIG